MIKNKKIIIFILAFLLTIGIHTTIYGKYVIDNTFKVAKVMTDETLPTISLQLTMNNNKNYPLNANKTHEIRIRVDLKDENIETAELDESKVKVFVGGIEEKGKIVSVTKFNGRPTRKTYDIIVNNLTGDGKLELKFAKGVIIDKAGNGNEEQFLDTLIKVDNTPPEVTITEQLLEDGKVKAIIKANENIQNNDLWERYNSDLSIICKNFPANVSYDMEILDFAQNTATIKLNITQATYIEMEYGALSAKNVWSFANQNNNMIAGKEDRAVNPLYKTELMSLYYTGKIDRDFIGWQGYMHTYWGEGKGGVSVSYEHSYNHGYIPNESEYITLPYQPWGMVNGKVSSLLGGDGVNRPNYKGIGGGNPIPEDIAKQYLFGMSSLKMKLKDESEFSIVYQIFLNEYGWQKAGSNGEETTYAHDKPFSAYRIAIVPNSEKGQIQKIWNKDIGTNNM